MGVNAEILFVLKKKHLTTEELHTASVEMCKAIGAEHFWIKDQWTPYSDGETHHALSFVDEHEQDGPTKVWQPGEQFVKVNTFMRYWGPGYERGPWPTIHYIILWGQTAVDAEVWYGGDSGGICAVEMVDERIIEYTRLYLQGASQNYWMRRPDSDNVWLCPTCKIQPSICGGGGGDVFLHCPGCRRKYIAKSDRSVYTAEYSCTDFFDREKFTVPVE